ncbi:MFS transporter [Paenibacillus sp. KACC 21273]|uniref:MFS transporter n=1 Tax=Paenibacillus sp. KACC 21273 TaxID=3025665 RepID=UPI002367336F|nr:MFS transporter [Paenibacillus sp. KACC 21273]WDF52850.1 MFS transporter [Paenibacillus sp. KACC 21273]
MYSKANKQNTMSYYKIWAWLFVGWVFSAADRAITGPIVTWMINHNVSFFNDVSNPHELGGLIGSLFFAGFMLTQFPGGYIGDKYGNRNTLILSLIWAGIATLFGGIVISLFAFIAFRVITGLGEGLYYSNDRTILSQITPPEKRSLGMGIVLIGLPVGVTIAYIAVALLSEVGSNYMGIDNGWRIPFVISGAFTVIVGLCMRRVFKKEKIESIKLIPILLGTMKFSIPFFIIIMSIYFFSTSIKLNNNIIAVFEIMIAILLLIYAFKNFKNKIGTTLKNKNLFLLYLGAFPLLWNLWFFNFWSADIIQKASNSSFLIAALIYAIFNAGAGIIGFPLGGWLADYTAKKGLGRKRIYLIFVPLQALSTIIFGLYLIYGNNSIWIMGIMLFISNLFLNIPQPISQALISEISDPEHRGSAFGMWNFIGQMAAVLAPVVSGSIIDAVGYWYPAIFLCSFFMLLNFVCVFFVRE